MLMLTSLWDQDAEPEIGLVAQSAGMQPCGAQMPGGFVAVELAAMEALVGGLRAVTSNNIISLRTKTR